NSVSIGDVANPMVAQASLPEALAMNGNTGRDACATKPGVLPSPFSSVIACCYWLPDGARHYAASGRTTAVRVSRFVPNVRNNSSRFRCAMLAFVAMYPAGRDRAYPDYVEGNVAPTKRNPGSAPASGC